MSQQQPAYIKDVLGQVWRNSEILKEKFDQLTYSFIFLAVAILPWTVALVEFAMRVPGVPAVTGK